MGLISDETKLRGLGWLRKNLELHRYPNSRQIQGEVELLRRMVHRLSLIHISEPTRPY